MQRIVVQADPFDPGAWLADFAAQTPGAGAIVTFTGLVRDDGGTLDHMLVEHYPGMTERALTQIADSAARRWPLTGQLILHRHGRLRPAAPIMMVATASAHRAAAFEAADFLMDYLKSRAPFWKQEVTRDGAAWVAAKPSDEDALDRWQTPQS